MYIRSSTCLLTLTSINVSLVFSDPDLTFCNMQFFHSFSKSFHSYLCAIVLFALQTYVNLRQYDNSLYANVADLTEV